MKVTDLPRRPISVDFEYIPKDDGSLQVVCVVAKDLWSGQVYRAFGDELGAAPPFPTGPDTVMVAYFSAAECDAFMSLGWDLPANILDLYAEHMRITNGRPAHKMHGVTGPRKSTGRPKVPRLARSAERGQARGDTAHFGGTALQLRRS